MTEPRNLAPEAKASLDEITAQHEQSMAKHRARTYRDMLHTERVQNGLVSPYSPDDFVVLTENEDEHDDV